MNIIKKILAAACIAALHPLAVAGSTDGLELVVVPTAKAAPYAKKVEGFFAAYEKNRHGYSCEDSQLLIEGALFKSAPTGITGKLAKAAVSDPKQRKKLGRMLTTYRDRHHARGFDGALVVDVTDKKIMFHAVSPMLDEKIYTSSLPLAHIDDEAKVAQAICRAVVYLSVLDEP